MKTAKEIADMSAKEQLAWINALIRSAQIEAFEEAATLACFRCKTTNPMLDPKATVPWFAHRNDKGRYLNCDAQFIHAKLAELRGEERR